MIKRYLGLFRVCALLIVIALVGNFGIASAEDANSSNYKITDTQFGSGSTDGCSASYCANGTAGDLTTGSGSSASFSAQSGSAGGTDDTPTLEVIQIGGVNNFGVLSSTSTASFSSVIKVKAYDITGYTIQISGAAPSQGEHTINTLDTPTTSQAGTEQFGVNLTANTSPSVGDAPVQVPNSTFSYGEPVSNYDQANKFMYNDGDIIASSSSSSGETDYTVSMILNISDATPAGQYTGTYSAVVVPVY